jgi:alkylation response protein AidB-like acyl-CoA dehydrogenase
VNPLTALSEEEELFQKTVREFADQEIVPRAAEMDREAKLDPDLIPKLYDLGILAIETPEQWGGAGGSFFLSILAVEEVSRADPSVGVVVDVQNTLVANAILRWGTEPQKEKFLSKMASGALAAYALSEESSGSDAFALQCRAVEDGDGYRLTGRKLWITNGADAELFLVFANANPDEGYRGITCFVVERGFDGFEVGRKEDKLGIRASSTCELILENVRVPRENVLGAVGQGGRALAARARGGARLHGRAQAVRPPHRRLPGGAVHARPHGDRDRGCAPDGLQRGATQGRG